MKFKPSALARGIGAALLSAALAAPAWASQPTPYFERIATFPAFLNTAVDAHTVAEIVAASEDGNTLVYTDAETGNLGFVDITDPAHPIAAGALPMGGEPTSVAVAGPYALVAVNTSASFNDPSGRLMVVEIASRTLKAQFELGGQPDSVAVSPDRRYAAIAIENERDEDAGDGRPPQSPPGFLSIVDLVGEPTGWSLREVSLLGLPELFPDDPEPEFVDINRFNIAALTLQENNEIVLVDLPSGRILNHWSAGHVDLENIDVEENDLIELNGALSEVPREPDGVTWISPFQLATADEGDLDGGSRGFTGFDFAGNRIFGADAEVDHWVTRLGHYPENRSENKGNEPENVEFGRYHGQRFLFVGSERSSLILVYRLEGFLGKPRLHQVLPSAVKPEGLLAIPQRDLLVSASEEDSRDDKIRSSLTLYRYRTPSDIAPAGAQQPLPLPYPTVASSNRADGLPIPWGALSALSVDPADPTAVYTVPDSFYRKTRILKLDISQQPALIQHEIQLTDDNGLLAAAAPNLVEADGSVDLDAEGIASRENGGFWLVSEGAGSVDDPKRPVSSPNLLLKIDAAGIIEQVVTLPDSVNARQRRFGFEGVAVTGSGADEQVLVAFQREWMDDPAGHVRIGRYQPQTGHWDFYFYPLDAPESVNGGWVGLSEISALGGDQFAVIERDNQAGTDAAVKRLYRFSLAGLEPQADPGAGITPAFPLVAKSLVRDLMPDLMATGGAVLEKIEGLTVLPDGTALIVNDNDGVDDSNGETQLLKLENLF